MPTSVKSPHETAIKLLQQTKLRMAQRNARILRHLEVCAVDLLGVLRELGSLVIVQEMLTEEELECLMVGKGLFKTKVGRTMTDIEEAVQPVRCGRLSLFEVDTDRSKN